MAFTLEISNPAKKEFHSLDPTAQSRALKAMKALGDEPRPNGYIKLKGFDLFRIRFGDYRIIYAIDDAKKRVTIRAISHRSKAY